jgi:predicted dehydrogenase
MSDVKMGVVGCGSIAEIAHFPSIAARKEAKVVAVCTEGAALQDRAYGSGVREKS